MLPIRALPVAVVIVVALLVSVAVAPPQAASGSSIAQLNSQLSQQQARQQSLSSSVGSLSGLIGSLDSQIALVRSREAVIRTDLSHEQAALATAKASLARERRVLARLRARLGRARFLLSRQLVSRYEGARPDLVSVVLDAHGFTDLLEQVDFLRRAVRQQQSIVSLTRDAKANADRAARRLGALEANDRQIADATAVRARAIAGMNALLQSKQSALQQARAVQQSALSSSRNRSRQLQGAIAQIQARQAAAQRAAAQQAAAQQAAAQQPTTQHTTQQASGSPASAPTGPALGPSGGWAIPYAIVLCESGGQNLPPNSAGASGYYQIIPSTWQGFGGSGPAAYLASKAEQDAVASRIWNGGAGASNWVCAGIVGIH